MTFAPTRHPMPWRAVGPHDVRLLRDGDEAFPAMLDAIRHARREVLLEMYWVGADLVGERFRELLAERARAGVRVRVIYDALGSIGINLPWWDALTEEGGVVHAFHGILGGPRSTMEDVEQRDHRKVLIVDGEVGFTGGLNLSAPWLPIEEGGAGWRDDVIAVRGPVVSELRALFFRTWQRVSGEGPPGDLRSVAKTAATHPPRDVYVLATHWRTRRSVHRAYVERIAEARASIDLANSYFVPDRQVLRGLLKAAGRGVRVRVLVPEKSDVPIVQYAVEASFETLLRHEVEIYALPGRMLHSKTAIVDSVFTTIGSYNLDHRSWRKNLELNVAVEGASFAKDVTSAFEEDLAVAKRIDPELWQARPGLRRGAEWVARRLRRLW